ncbi:hypothetical protein, partial [Paludibacterium sp.]|uniref:hypothetical protein n=1 Tax=Paludibacterium sp. TaxID=1917523 RepID=UPI0025DA2573
MHKINVLETQTRIAVKISDRTSESRPCSGSFPVNETDTGSVETHNLSRHCEQSEAIHASRVRDDGLLRSARNDSPILTH